MTKARILQAVTDPVGDGVSIMVEVDETDGRRSYPVRLIADDAFKALTRTQKRARLLQLIQEARTGALTFIAVGEEIEIP